MAYVVSAMKKISFAPSTVAEEVVQNVRTIIATRIGTVPLFRDFGVSWEGIDRPMPVAKAIIRAAVIEAVQTFEPRAVVDSVEWNTDMESTAEGLLNPIVTVSLSEGVEDTDMASESGTTISTVYMKADRAIALASDIIAMESDIASKIIELEMTDYVRIFDLASSGWRDEGTSAESGSFSAVESAGIINTVAMMIDAANTVASQVSADTSYYRKILHEFERIRYDEIYGAGSVVHEPFEISEIEPASVSSASGITDLGELSSLADTANASVIAARDDLLELERLLGEFERTAYTSIYEMEN